MSGRPPAEVISTMCRSSPETYSLIVRLNDRGVQLRVEGGRIRWKASDGAMTISLIREIKAHEAELVAILGELEVANG